MEPKRLIALFARHANAANLLMALILVMGIAALSRLNTQFFPDFGIDVVSVNIAWPGASAEDVEANIVQAIEPEVRFLNNVKRVVGYAVEGAATVVVEFEAGSNMQEALSDVEAGVGRITTLPEDIERPIIQRFVRFDTISRLVVSGDFPESSLKALAKWLREGLLAAGIDRVDLFGARDEEIWVELEPADLRRLDISLDDVAARIRASSQDIPSGNLSGPVERQIRSLGLATDAEAVGAIELRALDNGQKIYLRDVAAIKDTFEDGGRSGLRHGQAAIELHIQRSTSADALTVARTVDAFVDKIRPRLPPGLVVEQYDVQANLIRDRINLLLRNGVSGLVLVLGVLFLFLNARVAGWVAVGIPVAMMATMVVMLASGQSINMVSLFGLIMMLGIIVDDAIVVGEHAAALRRRGLSAIDAAEGGAMRMLAPVMSSSLTTIAAFLPIFIIGGIIGQIISAIPLVVVCVLTASLTECFLILPGHLRGSLEVMLERESRPRRWFNRQFDRFRDGPFRRAVAACVRWRYLALSVVVSSLALSGALVIGGHLQFVFFPSPESDTVVANVSFAPGTPRERTRAMLAELERALYAAEDELTGGRGGLVATSFGKVGQSSSARAFDAVDGDHLGGLQVELTPSDLRDVRTPTLVEAWRRHIRPLAGVDKISLVERRGGPPGRDVDIRFEGGTTDELKSAAQEVRDLLARYPGVSDIEDDLPYGRQELILELTPRGHALGFTTESVGRQVRGAFEGVIAKRFARGDEEVIVRVQYPREHAGLSALRELYLRSPSGAEVPLSEVVSIRDKAGFARIRREDGVRQVAVTAEVNNAVTNARELRLALSAKALPAIAARHGLSFELKGRAEEEQETLDDMELGAAVGLAAIYIILAWVFASYSRPIVVMLIIPFGLVGAVTGHLVMGYPLTILSLIGLLGLAGILVNNSIILVSVIDERLARGEPLGEAIVAGTQDRLRAVILTSATTVGGLLPLLFERSLQAQFLIPMALTLVCGLAVASVLVLIVVPVFLAVLEDVIGLVRARWRRPALGEPAIRP